MANQAIFLRSLRSTVWVSTNKERNQNKTQAPIIRRNTIAIGPIKLGIKPFATV